MEIQFESTEEALERARELIEKVHLQNEQWPGAGAFERDINMARTLLKQTEQALADLVVAISQRTEKLPGEDQESEARQAINRAYNIMSRLHDDIRALHGALEKGKTQSGALEQAGFHLQQLTHHCLKTRGQLLDAGRKWRSV